MYNPVPSYSRGRDEGSSPIEAGNEPSRQATPGLVAAYRRFRARSLFACWPAYDMAQPHAYIHTTERDRGCDRYSWAYFYGQAYRLYVSVPGRYSRATLLWPPGTDCSATGCRGAHTDDFRHAHSANVLRDVGGMREDFFIDHVDIEWSHRARSKS